jgi:SAM-dependent methyltransferase
MSSIDAALAQLKVLGTSTSQTRVHGCFVNLGCGSRYHPDWLNIDTWAPDPDIQRHDLQSGIPLPDNSVDAVYHSHVLEHFDRSAGMAFLRECFRVLKNEGIIRVVVPDLEKIARLYLMALEGSCAGSTQWHRNYEWMLLEMYDQAVRERPGGGITDYFRGSQIPNRDFVVSRMGEVPIRRLIDSLSGYLGCQEPAAISRAIFRRAKKRLARLGPALRERTIRILLAERDYGALQRGRFRQSGEVHKWMYDRYSLGKCLQGAGFVQIRECTASESGITGWQDFNLDTEPDGTVYKPDSLFMEAVKISSK